MTKFFNRNILSILIILLFTFWACEQNDSISDENNSSTRQDSIEFYSALTEHLNSVINKDFETLKTTLPEPNEPMILILPNGSLTTTAKEFLDIHKDWFQDSTWTIDFKIIKTNNTSNFGIALVESTYREPERFGKPYFNKMLITYAMKKNKDKWLVINDHASSIQKPK